MANVMAVGLSEIVVVGTWPAPLNVTDCGEPVAVSVMVNAAARVPAAAGLNVTLIEHVPLTANDAGQLFVSAKSPAFVPSTAMELIVTG